MSGLADMFDLKDEKQAKEYLDTLGVEYRFQCYHEKLPDGCHRLADHFEAFKREMDKARLVYENNCDTNKYGLSCLKAGNYSLLGRGGPKNPETALKYYEEGCKSSHGRCCHNVALMHQVGEVTGQKNYVKAEEYLKKSCELDNTDSCQLLSAYYIAGKEGVAKNMQKAFELAFKACNAGHMYACANLSQMYKRGEGTEQNAALAEQYKSKAKAIFKDVTESEKTIEFGK